MKDNYVKKHCTGSPKQLKKTELSLISNKQKIFETKT